LRIFLIFIFSLDKGVDYKNDNIYEEIQIFIVNLYILNWGISFLLGILIVLGKSAKTIFSHLISKIKSIKNSLSNKYNKQKKAKS
jgi:hypothetical protein